MDFLTEQEVIGYSQEFFAGDASGHDSWHTVRVYRTALAIARTEPAADRNTVAVAALLHDVDDRKLGGDPERLPRASAFLKDHGATVAETAAVLGIIKAVSFKGKDSAVPQTLEGKIVQDADRLDAIGAIGIARAFAYGGAHGRPLCDPAARPRTDLSAEEYAGGTPDTLSHFYEKLLLLKDLMNTAEGKRLAAVRHAYLVTYLDEFRAEWDGRR
jgi:uncharacterized protein